ncbi:hypothetical protein [Pseudomonas sp. Marseille-Q7302]
MHHVSSPIHYSLVPGFPRHRQAACVGPQRGAAAALCVDLGVGPRAIPTLSCKALCATRVEVGTLIVEHKATAFYANTPDQQGD